jgi:hypothetical protein
MNNNEKEAFLRTAKRMVDASKGKLTMKEARKEMSKILNKRDNRSK